MTEKENVIQDDDLEEIGFGCNYLPFSSSDNPCASHKDNSGAIMTSSPDVSAEEHESQLFHFCGRDLFKPDSETGGLTEEEIQEIIHSPCCCSEEEIQEMYEHEIHRSFGAD